MCAFKKDKKYLKITEAYEMNYKKQTTPPAIIFPSIYLVDIKQLIVFYVYGIKPASNI